MSFKLKITCLKCSSALLFLLFFHAVSAQSKKKNDKEYGIEKYSDLDALATRYQKQLGNDFVVMVWRDTLVYKHELGEFNAKTEAPLASASKWLTTALILILAEEGKLSLDDKITDYLPLYSNYGKNYITIRHCLSHFTGIQTSDKLLVGKIESLDEEALSYAKKEIASNPGTQFKYSNAGLMIAGRIAEIVTKKKFDQLIKQKLFNPLGMSKTTFSTLDGSGINPSDGARTTALDFMKFLSMLLHNGKGNGKQVMSEESVDELRKIHASSSDIKLAPEAVTGASYALGSWALEEKEGKATVLFSPGFYGAYPLVDWCRGYALLILPKINAPKEQKALPYSELKAAADVVHDANCN